MLIWHIFGWTTVAAQGALAIGVCIWLKNASRDSRSWRRPLRVPKFAGDVALSSGTDYVGLI